MVLYREHSHQPQKARAQFCKNRTCPLHNFVKTKTVRVHNFVKFKTVRVHSFHFVHMYAGKTNMSLHNFVKFMKCALAQLCQKTKLCVCTILSNPCIEVLGGTGSLHTVSIFSANH